jgi:hypothetical protein
MESFDKRIISTQDFFPLVRETLRNGQKVKFTVSGNSMLPWIADNRDQVLLTGTQGKQLRPGDIILFRNHNDRYIMHRIMKKEPEGYHTIGDACLFEDGPVQPADIIGVVEKIYRKGKVMDCNSLFWRSVFTAWRRLLPIRKYLIKLYYLAVRLKQRIK